MQLYAGTSREFISDATRNGIATKLERAFLDNFHYKPSIQEVQSWQNSLFRMAFVLQQGSFLDHGILLEYQLPLSSRRLDCMVTGTNGGGQPYSVIVELKQWSEVEESNAEDCVTTWVAGSKRDILHPSRQVGQYEEYLRDMHSVFVRGEVGLRSCAFLHNLSYDPKGEIFSARHHHVLKRYPAFTGDHQDGLITYMGDHLRSGRGEGVLEQILKSKFSPSKKLLEHTAQVVQDQRAYVLLDSQQVVFAKVLAEVRDGAKASKLKKTVVLVHGGPGTGKSVIALHLLGRLSGEGLKAMHLTGSKAFTENMRKLVGTRSAAQFGYFNVNKRGELPPNQFDALILDEAHRIRESSRDRFTKLEDWSGLPQIDELIHIARVSVFFIDDRQIVRPGEVGSSEIIKDAARRAGAKLLEYELDAQFRCSGSDGFINWVDNTLDVRRTANVLWKRKDPYDFRILDSVQDLDVAIRQKSKEGSARLVAGFCWPWSNPESDGSLVPDVQIDGWSMPWNARPEAGRLAAGIPKSNFWASDPGGLNQVGCVYTAQGFEFDYVGIIFGLDFRYDWQKNEWVGDKKQSHDTMVKRSKEQFIDLVKNTYRVLFTRGIKGCYVYFMDEGTRKFFQSRLE
ncbi:hypothetical protein AEP_00081 [Curvibacter sp. AEP1-3]|uniref:DUF2075 domain-containing protein n=1 Tax=Curvibacter sp. AEP1-3 TaxID=1844971 RepID=UPI000B3BFA8F|nr:DUF2075 domain-containing protein [Curvibacter sp. AEP1-3]ARV17047.1 hypothetical protein AEP_00081 [Curvibacter sp. AEP1-3]